MPHCVIEYSQDVADRRAISDLVAAVHAGALASGLFPEYDIKTRAIGYCHHQTGLTHDSFVHVAIHLLDGRSDAQGGVVRSDHVGGAAGEGSGLVQGDGVDRREGIERGP